VIRFIRHNPSARLPEAIYGRYVAGEHVSNMAIDYGTTVVEAYWAIELQAVSGSASGAGGHGED